MNTILTRAHLIRDGDSAPTVAEIVLPTLGIRQVRFKTLATGICRSQLMQISAAGERPAGRSRLLGHEAIARIEAVGRDVDEVAPGDLVLVGWVPRREAVNAWGVSGIEFETGAGVLHTPDVFTWTERGVCDAAFVYKLESEEADPDYSVIGCATFTGAGAVRSTLGVRAGESVAVIGVGGVGASAISAAAALGAERVVAVDVDDEKLAFARALGATHAVHALRQDVSEGLLASTDGRGLSAIADCVGTEATVRAALTALQSGVTGLARGGRLAIVGVPREEIALDLRAVQQRELTILGSFGGSTVIERDLSSYLDWIASGEYPLDQQITLRVPFEELGDGLARLRSGQVLGRAIATFSA